jgi:hypothetical protein
MPRLEPTTAPGSAWDNDRAWQFYAEEKEKTTLLTIAANLDNDQMTDAEFRDFVRRAVMQRGKAR